MKDSATRFFSMAETYNQMCQLLVPQYDFIQNEVLRLISQYSSPSPVVVDLGAGSGIFLERVLNRFSDAKCYWVDYSEDFWRVARDRLSRFGDRVEFVLAAFADDWEVKLNCNADVIFSMSAIHHLENPEKKNLYARCFDALSTNGWFFNGDEMKTLYDDAYINSLNFWVKHVEKTKAELPDEMLSFYEKWKTHFDNWKIRNIDNREKPKVKGDDIHESFITQLNWLHEIGFRNVDIFVKYHLWSVIGAQK